MNYGAKTMKYKKILDAFSQNTDTGAQDTVNFVVNHLHDKHTRPRSRDMHQLMTAYRKNIKQIPAEQAQVTVKQIMDAPRDYHPRLVQNTAKLKSTLN
jgi:predicted transcriptional regulator